MTRVKPFYFFFFLLTYTPPCTPLLRIYHALYVSTFPLKPNNGPGSFPIGVFWAFPGHRVHPGPGDSHY